MQEASFLKDFIDFLNANRGFIILASMFIGATLSGFIIGCSAKNSQFKKTKFCGDAIAALFFTFLVPLLVSYFCIGLMVVISLAQVFGLAKLVAKKLAK